MMAVHSLFMTLALAALAMLPAEPARAQSPADGCRPEQLGAQKAVDFGTAYAAANKRAQAWQADVVVVRLGNTILGPIDGDARSANW